jgi:hypothetical protein
MIRMWLAVAFGINVRHVFFTTIVTKISLLRLVQRREPVRRVLSIEHANALAASLTLIV